METVEQTTVLPVQKLPLSSLVLYRNPRTDLGDIELLIEQIIAAGKVNEPLSGFIDKGDFHIVEGKRRFTALKQMEERGGYDEIINNVPIKLIEDTSEIAISFLQLLSFERKDLTPLELAEEIDRLSGSLGVSTEEIAHRLKISTVYVNQLKRLANVPQSVKDAIKKGVVSSTQVRDAMKNGKLDELIAEIEALENGEGEGDEGVQGEKKVKAKVPAVNSLRDFRRFMKVFSRVYSKNSDIEVFEFTEAIANNELTYDDIVKRFVTEKNKAKAYTTTVGDVKPTKKDVDKSDLFAPVEKKSAPAKKVKKEKPSIAELSAIADVKKSGKQAALKASKAPVKAVTPKKAKEAVKQPKKAKEPTKTK